MNKPEKTRTVFYVARGGKDIKAFNSFEDACVFIKTFDGVCDGFDIITAEVLGNSSYAEMLNRKYDEGGKAEDKPQANLPQIKYEYHLQIIYGNAGWEYSKGIDRENVCHVYDNLADATKDMKWISSEIDKPTRIRKVGIYS